MRMLMSLHVVMNLVWVGSILGVGVLLARGPGDAKARGAAARTVYRALSVPAFVGSFVFGVAQLAQDPKFYFKTTHFMHAKLLLAVIVIAIHHVLGARARKMEQGTAEAGPAGVLTVVLALCAVGAAMLATIKPF